MVIPVGHHAPWAPTATLALAGLQVPTTVTAVLQDGRPAANTATAPAVHHQAVTTVALADIRLVQAVIHQADRPVVVLRLQVGHNFRRLRQALHRQCQRRVQASPPLRHHPPQADRR